jgi:hypothetical protein
LIRGEGLDLALVSEAFANDLLLALSCREAGVLLTENERDFARIRRFVPSDSPHFVRGPWPDAQDLMRVCPQLLVAPN